MLLNTLKRYAEGFVSIAYPEYCSACGGTVFRNEESVCGLCRNSLPKTNFHKFSDNPASKLFWGKCLIRSAAAYYYYKKSTDVQAMIHQMKYKGQKEVGNVVGNWYGQELGDSVLFQDVDLIIPVPLHPDKLKRRGYNQAENIGSGIAKALNVELDAKSLIRKTFTETQTKKRMFARSENVEDVFVYQPTLQASKHILMVDDVLTTGATLSACINSIRTVTGDDVTISVAALAITKH